MFHKDVALFCVIIFNLVATTVNQCLISMKAKFNKYNWVLESQSGLSNIEVEYSTGKVIGVQVLGFKQTQFVES